MSNPPVLRRATRSARFFQVTYGPGIQMPRHGHEPVAVSIVLSGGYEETVGRETRLAQPSHLIFHPADEEHAVTFGGVATSILRFEVKREAENYLKEVLGDRLHTPMALKTAEATTLAARLTRSFRSADPMSELALESQVFEALALVAGSPHRVAATKCQAARDFVDAAFAEPLGLRDVAQAVGAHPGALARSFRAGEGCTIGDYIRRKRLEHAAQLLLNTELSLAAIAVDCGFADQAHFTRHFSHAYRCTPGRFRKSFRLKPQ